MKTVKTRLDTVVFKKLLDRAKENCRSIAGEIRAILSAALNGK